MGNQAGQFFKFADRGPMYREEVLASRVIRFNEPQNIITLHPFTITSTNSTPVITNVGGRPCVQFAGGGAGTDGNNLCKGVAGILCMAGKRIMFRGALRSADITNHEFAWGLGAVGTGMIATDPSDEIAIKKLTSETVPSLWIRKASGTTLKVPLPTGALANDTWYDFAVIATLDSTTAGLGFADVYWGPNSNAASVVAGGGAIPQLGFRIPIATQFPDTVKMAEFCAWRAGSTVTTAMNFQYYGMEQEA